MIQKTLRTILALLCCTAVLTAQSRTVQTIRKEYQQVKSRISELKKAGMEGSLYCLHVEDNVYDASYPATGIYHTHRWFYYEHEGGKPSVLVMVVESQKVAAGTIYREWMFDNGTFLFGYEKDGYDDNIEKRIYCDGEKLIRYSENNTDISYVKAEERITNLKRQAYNILRMFNGFANSGE